MKQQLKIGILSDSHRETKLHQEAINHLVKSGADYLLHSGDLEKKEHLNMLEDAPIPYIAVYGNNDIKLISLYGKYSIYHEPHYFELAGLKIKMMHIPYYMNSDADIIIYGHTHIFEATMKGNTLFLNAGEVCAREKPLTECVMLEIIGDEYKVLHYFRDPNKDGWQTQEIPL